MSSPAQKLTEKPTWRERLRTSLVKEPIYISLTLRWFGWLVALVVVLTHAAPPPNLVGGPAALLVTGLVLIGMTLYPRYLRARIPAALSSGAPYLWPALDCLVALWSIHHTGGWDSPFYQYAVTIVLAPSLQFGLVGALVSSTVFTSTYMLTVYLTPLGLSPAFTNDHQPEPDLVSTPINPLMIGLYAAFLGEVLQKLRREMERSQILAAENERARMARDIHDGVSQTLFMLGMSLENGQVLAEKENAAKTSQHLAKLLPVARKALIELRDAMHNSDPLSSDPESLAAALRHLARDYQSATGIDTEVILDEGFDAPPALTSTLFRMAQEALSNACQHSGGDRVTVHLQAGSIQVTDNGKGFDREGIKPGRGLSNLEQRAQESQLALHSQSGPEGTSVKVSWNGDNAP